MSIPLIAIYRPLWESSWTNIRKIMLKLCLNPNYKQVLGELSRPVSAGSTPGHCVAHCCAQGFFLVQFNNFWSSSVRGKRHTTRVFYDVLNSVIDFMMMKRCHMATSLSCIEVMAHVLSSGEILRTLFCTLVYDMVSWIFTPWKNSQLKQAKKEHIM